MYIQKSGLLFGTIPENHHKAHKPQQHPNMLPVEIKIKAVCPAYTVKTDNQDQAQQHQSNSFQFAIHSTVLLNPFVFLSIAKKKTQSNHKQKEIPNHLELPSIWGDFAY